MHSWEQIQTTIDYLEAHIDEDVDIDDLAKMAALSRPREGYKSHGPGTTQMEIWFPLG